MRFCLLLILITIIHPLSNVKAQNKPLIDSLTRELKKGKKP